MTQFVLSLISAASAFVYCGLSQFTDGAGSPAPECVSIAAAILALLAMCMALGLRLAQ